MFDKNLEEEENEGFENYELGLIPKMASDESKTGITFKGNDEEYLTAHKKLLDMIKKKGERFVINGVEIGIIDTPKNKPVSVEIKPKYGLTGKANLKIYDKNAVLLLGPNIFIGLRNFGKIGHFQGFIGHF